MTRYKNYLVVIVFALLCAFIMDSYLAGLGVLAIGVVDLLFFVSKAEKQMLESKEKADSYHKLAHQYLMDLKIDVDINGDDGQVVEIDEDEEVLEAWQTQIKDKIDRKLKTLTNKKSIDKFMVDNRIRLWEFEKENSFMEHENENNYRSIWLSLIMTFLIVILMRLLLSPLFKNMLQNTSFMALMILLLVVLAFFIHTLFIKELQHETNNFEIQ